MLPSKDIDFKGSKDVEQFLAMVKPNFARSEGDLSR